MRTAQNPGSSIAPARCVFRRGLDTECGRKSPLRKKTSAAYGVGHHPIANVTAVGARCRPSSHRRLSWGFCPVKRGRTRHTRFGITASVEILLRRWLSRCCRGRGHDQHRRQIPRAPSPTAVPGQAFFIKQAFHLRDSCEECLTWLRSAPLSAIESRTTALAVARLFCEPALILRMTPRCGLAEKMTPVRPKGVPEGRAWKSAPTRSVHRRIGARSKQKGTNRKIWDSVVFCISEIL